jgi:hypothetical protein
LVRTALDTHKVARFDLRLRKLERQLGLRDEKVIIGKCSASKEQLRSRVKTIALVEQNVSVGSVVGLSPRRKLRALMMTLPEELRVVLLKNLPKPH